MIASRPRASWPVILEKSTQSAQTEKPLRAITEISVGVRTTVRKIHENLFKTRDL